MSYESAGQSASSSSKVVDLTQNSYIPSASICSSSAYDSAEDLVFEHICGLYQVYDHILSATLSARGLDQFAVTIMDQLASNPDFHDICTWRLNLREFCIVIIRTELLYQLTSMYGLQLELCTPHRRPEHWFQSFFLARCGVDNLSDLTSSQAVQDDLACWYYVTVVSPTDSADFMAISQGLRLGRFSSSQLVHIFQSRFESLQEHWIRFVLCFGICEWPDYVKYKSLVDRLAVEETFSVFCHYSQMEVKLDRDLFFTSMLVAVTHLYWMKWQNLDSVFYLSRLLCLLRHQEPSICKGFIAYGAAILDMDLSDAGLSSEQVLSFTLLQLMNAFQDICFRSQSVQKSSVSQSFTVSLPLKVVRKLGFSTPVEHLGTIRNYVFFSVLPQLRNKSFI